MVSPEQRVSQTITGTGSSRGSKKKPRSRGNRKEDLSENEI